MKYVIVLADGMADYPVPALNGNTPLQVSRKPNMNFIASHGQVGMVKTVPSGMPPGSDVANLSVMGYDPRAYYTGRSPLEAVSIGIKLGADDIAFRCNLVTLSEEPAQYEQKTMVDYSSDEISTEEASVLINDLATRLNSEQINFYPGISYRHLMVWRKGPISTKLTPPHDISDRPITPWLPAGDGQDTLLDLMKKSQAILNDHPINREREKKGLRPANSIWLWGQGKKPSIPSFFSKYGLNGSVISAVDLAKGLGICAGMQVINVPGATGNVHTNFKGKAEAALSAIRGGQDFIYLHVEAPDEAGHRGEIENKILSIERIDADILEPLLRELPSITDCFKLMVLPDHPTPLTLKTHVSDPVPFAIYQSDQPVSGLTQPFDELSAAGTGLMIENGYQLMDQFINNSSGR